jgi:hypothetical protein
MTHNDRNGRFWRGIYRYKVGRIAGASGSLARMTRDQAAKKAAGHGASGLLTRMTRDQAAKGRQAALPSSSDGKGSMPAGLEVAD